MNRVCIGPRRAFLWGSRVNKTLFSGVDFLRTLLPAANALFSLPPPGLMHQHHLNCFTAACVYFTHTLTFPVLLLPTHTLAYTRFPQEWLAPSPWTACVHSVWQPLQVCGSLTPDWNQGLSLLLRHLNNLTVHLLSWKERGKETWIAKENKRKVEAVRVKVCVHRLT